MDPGLVTVGPDGARRCWWGSEPAEYRRYHDREWGFGVTSDERLFEKICLEGFQAGLSWLTVLRKRENFRDAFSGFDPALVVEYGERDTERLMANAGIIRHRGKIRSVINNAARALEMVASHGSLSVFFWEWAEFGSLPLRVAPPAFTDASAALAKELRGRGWTFVGPTTCYAFMQAMGLVNDHLEGCWVRREAEVSRRRAAGEVLKQRRMESDLLPARQPRGRWSGCG